MAALSEKGISYTAGFFMLIAFAIGGMMFGGIISIPILMVMTGENITSASDIISNPVHLREMQVVQTVSTLFGFLIPTLFAASRLSYRPLELTGFKGNISFRQAWLVALIMLCGFGISSALGHFSYQIPFPQSWKVLFEKWESDYAKMAANLINLNNPFELIISIIVLALIPAICEETLFRGGFQNYLYRSTKKMWLSILVVSLIFSAVHFSAYGFLSRFALGIILGLIFHYSGRLWLSILAHFINNAVAVLAMYSQKSSGKSIAEIMNDKSGNYLGFIAIPVIIFLFIKFRKESRATINYNSTADGI